MFTQAEIEYIQKQIARGLNKDAIKNKLIEAGWDRGDIDDGFKEVEKLSAKSEVITTPVVSNSSPIEVQGEKIPNKEENLANDVESVKDEPTAEAITTIQTENPIQNQSVVQVELSAQEMSPKNNNTLIKIFITVIIVLIVGASAALAYYKFVYKKINNFVPESETATSTVSEVDLNQDGVIPELPLIGGATKESLGIDCKEDFACFIQAADECTPAYVTSNVTNDAPFGIGTIATKSIYRVMPKVDNNCTVWIKITDASFKYSELISNNMIEGGMTKEIIAGKEAEMSEVSKGSGQICHLDASKKIGSTIKEEFFSGKISTVISSNGPEYKSGLICESFAKMNDDPNCKISFGAIASWTIQPGAKHTQTVSGISGDENLISWSVDNANVVSLSSSTGKKVDINGISAGKAKVTVTDNAIGKHCTTSIDMEVEIEASNN